MGWYFWLIAPGWRGRYSKAHFIPKGSARTLCGRYPEPEVGNGLIEADKNVERCKICAKKEQGNGLERDAS